MFKEIPVIDLFAGPGGLGEGFSSLKTKNKRKFKIKISIEMEKSAHKTLSLRAFYRQFENKENVPKEYYEFINNKYSEDELNKLFDTFPEGIKAREEARCLTLGEDNEIIHSRISEIVSNFKKKQDWVLIGGPPCQAFSLAGRVRNKGKKDYIAEEDNRHFLYREYLEIIGKYHPSVFVMENVKGILSAKINGSNIFENIVSDLKFPNQTVIRADRKSVEYKLFSLSTDIDNIENLKPKDFIIKSEKYGIPQKRHRVIIIGIRNDIKKNPRILKQEKMVSVEQTISDLPSICSGITKIKNADYSDWINAIKDFPELSEESFRTPPENFEDVINKINDVIQNISKKSESSLNCDFNKEKKKVFNPDWYKNEKLKRFSNHERRNHMKSDLHRYLYVSSFGLVNSRSPKLNEFPLVLLPNHKNAQNQVVISKFVDRFKVQINNRPSTTITCHISKDGHYYIHPDPEQCRSLTVREAARLQTFPDDYFFCGNKTQQYHQVGNAVPPLLANKIAQIVMEVLN